MSASNTTLNLGLPQFGTNDVPTWEDINTAFAKIDAIVGDIAPVFSTSSTYDVGDYVQYNGGFYKCKVAVSQAGEWDATDWDAVVITTAMQDAQTDLANCVKVDMTNGTGITSAQYSHLTVVPAQG